MLWTIIVILVVLWLIGFIVAGLRPTLTYLEFC